MLIGLVGFIGNGKGTIADELVKSHGFIKESFANSVKDAVSTIFGWDRSLLEGDTVFSRGWREEPDAWWSNKMGKPFSPRLALQLMGTEAGRDVFHSDLWIHSLERRVNPNKNYVVADVRFPNEINAIHKMGGKIVRVRRGPNPEWYQTAIDTNSKKDYYGMAEQYPEVHYSEWAWVGGDIDITLDNNQSLNEITNTVNRLIWSLNTHVEDFDDEGLEF